MGNITDDVEDFRATLDEEFQGFEVVCPPNERYQAAAEICSMMGFRFYCCSGLNCIGVTNFISIFVGVPEHDLQHPLWVTGHEVWHMLQRRYCEIIYPFQERSIELLRPGAIKERRFVEDGGAKRAMSILIGRPMGAPESAQKTVIDEVFADIYANAWCDIDFWLEVRNRSQLKNNSAIDSMLAILRSERIAVYRQWHNSPSTARDQLAEITVSWLIARLKE